jgi:hypothetical protein
VDQDIDIRPETLKQLQEAIGNTLEHIGIGNDFLNRTLMSQQLRERGLFQTKKLLYSKRISH